MPYAQPLSFRVGSLYPSICYPCPFSPSSLVSFPFFFCVRIPFAAFAFERCRAVESIRGCLRHSPGFGRMYAFNDRVSDADAWAIVAYMRVFAAATPVALRPQKKKVGGLGSHSRTVYAHTPLALRQFSLFHAFLPPHSFSPLSSALSLSLFLLVACVLDRPCFFAAWLSAWWFFSGSFSEAAANSQIRFELVALGRGLGACPLQLLGASIPWAVFAGVCRCCGHQGHLSVVFHAQTSGPLPSASRVFNGCGSAPASFGLRLAVLGSAWWALSEVAQPQIRPLRSR